MTEKRPKVFFMVSRFPYPLIKGDKLRAFHQIKYLSNYCDIYLCALSDENVKDEWKKALLPFCKEIIIHRLKLSSIISNVIYALLFTKKPLQTAYFYNSKIESRIKKDIERINADHIFCQLIRTALYVKDVNDIPKTLDYMDALSAGMERRAQTEGILTNWLFNLEARRLRKFEHFILKFFDNAVIISESDRSLIFHYENEEIVIVPNGVETDHFNKVDVSESFDILFTGNMSYPPNVQSAVYLIKNIIPKVLEVRPETKVLISGANPVKKIRMLASENVKILGFVEDIRESYSASKIFCAPMQIGSGLQNKLLEAMAMKMPCISSELANKSLGAVEGSDILVGRNSTEYAQHILSLLGKPEKALEIGENGYRFVSSHFNWMDSTRKILDLIKDGKVKKPH